MKQVKHNNVFVDYTKYKSAWVYPDIFWKIDLKAFFFFSTEH